MFSFNVLTNLKKRISRERKLHQILSLTKMSRIVPISVLVDVPPDDLCPLKLRNYRYLYFSHFQLPDLARSTPSTRPKKEAERSKLLAGDVPGRPVRHPSYRNVCIHTTFNYQLSSNNPFLELICLFFFYS